tara:strand:- start:339 stop:671 length:333 start_codon:yes stop_codon:yes gene_type:complete
MDDKLFLDFDPNDFIIRLAPLLDDDGMWTGELKIGTITTQENNLDVHDYDHLMFVSTLVSSCIPLMEESAEFRDMLYNYTNKVLKQNNPDIKDNVTVETGDDNVIQLKFH